MLSAYIGGVERLTEFEENESPPSLSD